MNNILSFISQKEVRAIAMAIALTASACGGDDPAALTQTQKVTETLTSSGGTWTPSTSGGVTVDGVDVTEELFAGFTITFRDGTYTTTGTSPVWPAEDTWKFKDETATVIIRGVDQKEVTITAISASQLKLSLEWSETTYGGRKSSLKGKHEFNLNK